MSETFHIGAFLARWHDAARHDLSASHSETLSLSALLALATPQERANWEQLPLGYASPHGGLALRALIAARHDGLQADDVICCAGAQEAMACVARALLAPGDHAVVVLPIYQPLEWAVTDRVGATGVRLEPESFRLDVARVAAAMKPETRLVLTNFPNSPTGAVLDPATQAALVALCRARGVWLVNDEVYRQTVSEPARQSPPVADVYERGVSINALSKGFGLPGLRVGWAACHDRALLARIATAKAALSSCLAAPTELLAQIALREEALLTGRTRALGTANRQHLDRLLCRHAALFEADPPRNLAFAFPRYRGAEGAEAFAARLIAEAGTLLLPASLWRSPLAAIADDRLRISLGQPGVRAGLKAIDVYLNVLEAV
ncbi:pyridoxal phosphate-dependent aminotransferase [Rhodopila sp.]|uniref:pyridoxal phosphate-dependent aminotransferase n=1 Tax=Rhodopila sp. TaxID=2480087 RepID=UPI003D0C0F07